MWSSSSSSSSSSSTLQMQYSFIYQALLEYYLYGDTELDVCSLEGHLHRLHNTRAPNDRLGLEEEFRVGLQLQKYVLRLCFFHP